LSKMECFMTLMIARGMELVVFMDTGRKGIKFFGRIHQFCRSFVIDHR
jgi:hypothetical protein